MNHKICISDCSGRNDLRQVIEPLANYICATEQPRQVLLSALAVLFREVAATNQAAVAHFNSYSEN
jgi:hypothetical protein